MTTPLFILFALSAAHASVIQFNDGQTHYVDYPYTQQTIWVDYNKPTAGTSLHWLDGADGYNMTVFGAGTVVLDGGRIYSGISGGCGCIAATDYSTVTVISGSVQESTYAAGQAHLSILGGIPGVVYATEQGTVEINGGSPTSVGGFQQGVVQVRGGAQNKFFVDDLATIEIFGYGFLVDGTPATTNTLTSIGGGGGYYYGQPVRWLSGMLANGSEFNAPFFIGHDAKIVLTTVPIPAAGWLFALGLLGIGAVAGRRIRTARV